MQLRHLNHPKLRNQAPPPKHKFGHKENELMLLQPFAWNTHKVPLFNRKLNHIGHWGFTLFNPKFWVRVGSHNSPLVLLQNPDSCSIKYAPKICQLLGEFLNQTIHKQNLIFFLTQLPCCSRFALANWAPNFAKIPCSMLQVKPECPSSKTPLNFQVFLFSFYLPHTRLH